MKYSGLYAVAVGLALSATCLPTTALAEKKTAFTSRETDTRQNAGLWLTDGKQAFAFGGRSGLVEEASDPRVAGSGWYSINAVVDLQTGASTFWGEFHIENARGAWHGYWQGKEGSEGLSATLTGSGKYEGLVSRWTSTSHGGEDGVRWSGYIVENGPGDVPLKITGWRIEQLEVIPGMVLDPITMMPTGKFGAIGKGTLVSGGGKASHMGPFTDRKQVGLLCFTSETTADVSSMGIVEAVNGDLFKWVAFGTANLAESAFDVSIHFAGGTGRFDHAVGSFDFETKHQPEGADNIRYSYSALGRVRY
jgi:hypothetical protein